jgi:hypothetical protein
MAPVVALRRESKQTPEEALHTEALERFHFVADVERPQRTREDEDLRFDAGDQWPEDVKRQRGGTSATGQPTPARPMITIRTLDQPTAQIVNQARTARFGIKISPKSDASQDDADVRQGLIRAIEYDSHAQTAYLWAYNRAVVCGRGFFRIDKVYAIDDPDDASENPAAWDQDLRICPILNGASVYLDPFTQDLNDPGAAEWAFVTQDLPKAVYVRQFGDSKLASADDEELIAMGDQRPDWILKDEKAGTAYRIAEYWYATYASRTETHPTDPSQTREIKTRTIMWAKVNGMEVLDGPKEWDGQFIPIVPVIGIEKNLSGARQWEGIVRGNRDPCRMINYLVSSDAENMGLATKAPWIGYKGQFEGFEAQWQAANTRNQPYLEVNAITDGVNSVLPKPERNIPTYPPSTEAIGMYVNFVRSTTGVPDAALGHVNANDRSGRAIAQLQQASEQGTSNFPDHLQRAIRHGGVILNDLLGKVYDRPGRVVQILTGDDDQQQRVMLNQPFVSQGGQPQPVMPGQPSPMTPSAGPTPMPGPPGPQGAPMAPPVQHFDLSKGQYSVIVDVGKSYATRRQAAMDGLSALAQAVPPLVPQFADLWVKSMDFPEAQAIADRIKPPGAQTDLPPQIQAAVQGLQQENQQLKMAIQTKQVEAQAKLQETQVDNASREKIAMINASAQIAVAGAKIDAENARTYIDALENRWGKALDLHMEKLTHATQLLHDEHQGAMDRTHDVNMAGLTHDQTMQQADQAQQHTQANAEQQAALTPEPAAEGEPTA